MSEKHCLKDLYEDDSLPCDCPVCQGLRPVLTALALGLILLTLAWLVSCVGAGHPVVTPPSFNEAAAKAACERIWRTELLRGIDPSGLIGCVAEFRAGASEAQVTANVRRSHEWASLHNPPPPQVAPVIHPDGRIFRTADGQPWRWKGVSAFRLARLHADGNLAAVDAVLKAYAGFNVLRVWDYTDWAGTGWVSCTPSQWRAFLSYVGANGWTVELTLLTNDDPAKVGPAKALVVALAASPRPTNLLIEIGNEPATHKSINTAALKATLDASGFVYASGNYEDSTKAFGTYLTAHSRRDAEWPRRAHDCLDFYNGGGPNKPTDPAHRVPCILDEPAKLQDVQGDRINDWRAYFGAAALLAAGGTFHSETGKFGQPPTAEESALAAAALEGLNAFPADAPLGSYGRPVENSLRTYTVGPFMVRVRPTTPTPGSGWQRIGASNVLWKR